MGDIRSYQGNFPNIHPDAWVAEDAVITGRVEIGAESSIFFKTVIRGDVNNIVIGERTNIQDHAMVHGSDGRGDTLIGDDVTVGHRAIIHGCQIKSNVLIGMGAIILDDAIINEEVIVAAGALVSSGKVLESGFLYAGIPARKIKPLDQRMIDNYIYGSAEGYVQVSQNYKLGFDRQKK